MDDDDELHSILCGALTDDPGWSTQEWERAARRLAEALCEEQGKHTATKADREGLLKTFASERESHRIFENTLLAALDLLPTLVLKAVWKIWRTIGFLPSREWRDPNADSLVARSTELRQMLRNSGALDIRTTWDRASRGKVERVPKWAIRRGRPKTTSDKHLITRVDAIRSARQFSDVDALRHMWQEDNPGRALYRRNREIAALKTRLSRARAAVTKTRSNQGKNRRIM